MVPYTKLVDNVRRIVILPIAAVEQHGPFLPLMTDSIITDTVVKAAEKKTQKKTILYPTVYYGCSREHIRFKGTVTVDFSVFKNYVEEILTSLVSHGFRKIILACGHGGNNYVGKLIESEWNYNHTHSKVFYHFLFNEEIEKEAVRLFGGMEWHAGTVESSVIAAIDSTLITSGKKKNKDFFMKNKKVFTTFRTDEVCRHGILNFSDTVEINKEKGEKLLNYLVLNLVKYINQIQK
jgi:creatinine amidohydrolase